MTTSTTERVAAILRERARQGETITYMKLGQAVGLSWRGGKLFVTLDAINRREHEEGRPYLTAVVVHSGDGMPGLGFFDLVQELELRVIPNLRTFWLEERQRVHDYWADRR